MDKEKTEAQNSELIKDLPIMASELLRWSHSQICVVENRFDDNEVNPNEFEGYCNGFLTEHEEDVITEALSKCDNSQNRFDISLPLVISAKVLHSNVVNGVLAPSVLYMECGAAYAWKYELTAGIRNGNISGIHIFVRNDKGVQISVTDKAVTDLFVATKDILSYRMQRTGKVEFLIK